MLVKFQSRETRDLIYEKRMMVMQQNCSIREHLTAANLGLLNRVFNHAQYKFSMSSYGKIFAVTDDNYKISVPLFDDLNDHYSKRNS